MKVLVTGGAGFIGSHLVAALLEAQHEVRVLDDLSSGKRENLAGLDVQFVEGDVADFDCVQTAVSGCELVFHQAALVSVPKSVKLPALNHATNVTGTFNLFEAARMAKVSRIVYASSAAVYGNLPKLPKQESDPPAPITPYAMAKRTNELMANVYAEMYGMELVGLRYMNVFGPRQDPSSPYSGVLSIFCRQILSGAGVTIHGDGEQTRDFIFVQDVVKANLLAGLQPLPQPGKAACFNVGRGIQTSLNQVVGMLSQIINRAINVTYGAARPRDIKHSVADIRHIQSALGFVPETAVFTGLKQTLDWYQSVASAS